MNNYDHIPGANIVQH